jgi:hypothetical protein
MALRRSGRSPAMLIRPQRSGQEFRSTKSIALTNETRDVARNRKLTMQQDRWKFVAVALAPWSASARLHWQNLPTAERPA